MSDIEILVGSHDRYSAAWPILCHSIHKYWPDCPWPVYIITNHETAPCGQSLKVGGDRVWGVNTLKGLEKVDAKVIFWLLEDVWLTERADTRALKDFGEIVLRGQADGVRVFSSWKGKVRAKGVYKPDPRLMIFAHRSMYKIAAELTFYNVEVFKSLIRKGDTIWKFEQAGKRRTRYARYRDRFLCVKEHKYFRVVMHTKDHTYKSPWASCPITRGKWRASARRYAEREGLKIDFTRHPDGTPVEGPLR